AMRDRRGRDLAMVFQDPLSSLNPVVPIGLQVTEVLERHRGMPRKKAVTDAVELLTRVGIPDPRRRLDEYPHQLSGGMRQRALIAMALACRPRLLIADEPTTALDVTIQAQILALLAELVHTGTGSGDTALMMITHDLGIIAGLCDEVNVLYGGRVVERGLRHPLFAAPHHPYTVGLLASIPRLDAPRGQRLVPIRGSVGDTISWSQGCAFAPRCPNALDVCTSVTPGIEPGPDQRLLRCHNPVRTPEIVLGRRPFRRLSGGHFGATSPPPSAPRAMSEEVLLDVKDLRVYFPVRRGVVFDRTVGHVHAVDGVSLAVRRGETYGLVGESGCGKSTLGRAMLRVTEPTGGRVVFDGTDLSSLKGEALRRMRRRMQMVFQNPLSSLDPRQSVASLLMEGLRAHDLAKDRDTTAARLRGLLDAVGLPASALRRYPHEFSGGQRQRIGIARALTVEPDLIIADEPVSALDVSVQAQILNLLEDLQSERGLTYLVITHDLAVVRHIADRVGVMYLGGLVEEAGSDELYAQPLHPYTKALLSAVPVPDPEVEDGREQILLTGDLPSPAAPPSGCRFHTRCPWRQPTRCDDERPTLRAIGVRHRVACHWAEDIAAGLIERHEAAPEAAATLLDAPPHRVR
ncbi:MAG: ABC transporter ATP-binding protein, partial [Actinomycetota bacterium]|nr:ABC transporter ATP-binding protein [Actinomycetota bacterium]